VNICVGDHAVKHVVMEFKQDTVIVIIQFQNMVGQNAMEKVNKLVVAILDIVPVSN